MGPGEMQRVTAFQDPKTQDTTNHSKVNWESLGKRSRRRGEFAQLISESLERERLDKEGLVKRERIIISIFRLPRRDRWNLEERGKFVVQKERRSHPGPPHELVSPKALHVGTCEVHSTALSCPV